MPPSGGIVAVDAGIPASLALAMSVIVNSGGVQMVAVTVARLTKNLPLTVIVGMTTLWVFQAIAT